jgi:hypothetical protein
MGIPLTVIVISGAHAKRDEILPLAAYWIGQLAVLHSQIDFSLEIPGFSVAICTLIGIGLAQSASGRGLNLTH